MTNATKNQEDYQNGMLAEGWRPDANESISGTVVGLYKGGGDGKGEYGFYPIIGVKLKDGSGFRAVHAFHTLLQDALRTANENGTKPVKVGDMVTITYEGKRESKNSDKEGKPQTYHVYTVFVNGTLVGAREEWTW